MGSLMAGWDSPVSDPKAVKFERNRSLTKEEIATFWRSKKKTEDQNVNSSSKLSSYHDQENRWEEGEKRLRRSSSVPPLQRADAGANTYNLTVTDVHEEQKDNLLQKNGWWISSNWAFLNEPPVISEGPYNKSKYASQFHVAHIA